MRWQQCKVIPLMHLLTLTCIYTHTTLVTKLEFTVAVERIKGILINQFGTLRLAYF